MFANSPRNIGGRQLGTIVAEGQLAFAGVPSP
jgi:hypothetical protein